ncbi:MAG: hypothetical protein M1469_07470 [Bacteroidetes bacterium]|nr:hypothetical protein [Bacteroidota bacterium]
MGKDCTIQIRRFGRGWSPIICGIAVLILLFDSSSMAQLTSSLQLGYIHDSNVEQDNWNHSLDINYQIQFSRVADNLDSSQEVSSKENVFSMPRDSLESFLTFFRISEQNRTALRRLLSLCE